MDRYIYHVCYTFLFRSAKGLHSGVNDEVVEVGLKVDGEATYQQLKDKIITDNKLPDDAEIKITSMTLLHIAR